MYYSFSVNPKLHDYMCVFNCTYVSCIEGAKSWNEFLVDFKIARAFSYSILIASVCLRNNLPAVFLRNVLNRIADDVLGSRYPQTQGWQGQLAERLHGTRLSSALVRCEESGS